MEMTPEFREFLEEFELMNYFSLGYGKQLIIASDLFKEIPAIKTKEQFDAFVERLESKELTTNIDYALYNKAFEQLYGHPAFDDDGNFWEED